MGGAQGDSPQLLHVEVQQVTGSRVLVAHRLSADAMESVEAVEPEAPEDRVDGGAGEAERPGDAMCPEAVAELSVGSPYCGGTGRGATVINMTCERGVTEPGEGEAWSQMPAAVA